MSSLVGLFSGRVYSSCSNSDIARGYSDCKINWAALYPLLCPPECTHSSDYLSCDSLKFIH